jgi:hypothetical protein
MEAAMTTTTTLGGKDVRDLAARRKKIDVLLRYDPEPAQRNERALLIDVLRRIADHEPGDWGDLAADLAIVQAYARAALPVEA